MSADRLTNTTSMRVPTTFLSNNGEGPIDLPRLCESLDILADAFKSRTANDYGMRIPAEPYRDGDLVCALAMIAIKQFQEITAEMQSSLTASGERLHGARFALQRAVDNHDLSYARIELRALEAILAKDEVQP